MVTLVSDTVTRNTVIFPVETGKGDFMHSFIDKLRGLKFRITGSGEYDCARVFAQAKAATEDTSPGNSGRKRVAIISPSGNVIVIPAPPAAVVSDAHIAQISQIISPNPPRTVAAIADTRVSGSVPEISKTIPFAGILIGMAYIGHRVIVFDGQLSGIREGCRDSDVLIVDGAVLPHLHHDWYTTAKRVMRRPEIYMHDRNTFKLRPVLPKPAGGMSILSLR